MPYDDPMLKEFSGYFEAKEPGRRERADAWATAIGLQKVDGFSTSRFLVETAKDHIEGCITQAQKSGKKTEEWMLDTGGHWEVASP